jgi:hypothetical protein
MIIFLCIGALLFVAAFVCVVDIRQKRCIMSAIKKTKAEIETLERMLLRERQANEMLLTAEQTQSEQDDAVTRPCRTCGAKPDEYSGIVWHLL